MNGVQVVNSAVFRDNLSDWLDKIAKGAIISIARFGQPKAVVVNKLTFKIQQTLIALLDKFPKLNDREQETLNLLMDKKARRGLIEAMKDLESGRMVAADNLFK